MNQCCFGQAARVFRLRAGREKPSDSGPNRGDVVFFDVRQPPPRTGRPGINRLLSFEGLITEIKKTYDARNYPPFEWAED